MNLLSILLLALLITTSCKKKEETPILDATAEFRTATPEIAMKPLKNNNGFALALILSLIPFFVAGLVFAFSFVNIFLFLIH